MANEDPDGLLRTFEDGDIVEITRVLPDGQVVKQEIDYAGICAVRGQAYVEEALYRPDHCADWIPLGEVTNIRLVKARGDRTDQLHGDY